ncbi:MAG: hypothetical protein R6X33_13275 [Candidatus Brocadiia bacterium]
MKRCVQVLLVTAFLSFSASVGTFAAPATHEAEREATEPDPPRTQQAILEELRALRQDVADLTERVEKLEEKLSAEQAEEPEPQDSPGMDSWLSGFRPHEREGPDLEALRNIKLAEDPTEQQVRDYVRRILQVSDRQTVWSQSDPQVGMLARVGPEHLETLLETGQPGDISAMYITGAALRLIGKEHKELALRWLPVYPDLVTAVVRRGWVDEAKQTLVQGLRGFRSDLPEEWIQAVASLRDPTTYDVLKDYLIHGQNRKSTYEAIRKLPDIELAETVEKAWKASQYAQDWEKRRMAQVALDYGHKDALGYLIDRIQREDNMYARAGVWGAILRHMDQSVPFDQLPEWFEKNKERIAFDSETKKFYVPDEE